MKFAIDIPTDGADRIEIAEKFVKEYCQGKEYSYNVNVIGDHAVIDDGADCWVCDKDDYEAACQSIVDDIIDGQYDNWYSPDDDGVTPYDVLCQSPFIDVLYSNLGGVADKEWWAELDDDQRNDLIDHGGEAMAYAFGWEF